MAALPKVNYSYFHNVCEASGMLEILLEISWNFKAFQSQGLQESVEAGSKPSRGPSSTEL